jgi:hypothetical protein
MVDMRTDLSGGRCREDQTKEKVMVDSPENEPHTPKTFSLLIRVVTSPEPWARTRPQSVGAASGSLNRLTPHLCFDEGT